MFCSEALERGMFKRALDRSQLGAMSGVYPGFMSPL
jgi:hypothetical protein